MKDRVVRSIAFNDSVRIYAVSNTDALNVIGDLASYLPSALDAVGRVVSMGVMMGSTLKEDETITLKIEGDGPIGKILVEADAHGHVRAYCDNPRVHFESNDHLNCISTIGDKGFVNVIKDLKLKEPFIGSTPIIKGDIATDFAYYYNVSEQVPTAISLGTLVDTDSRAVVSGGYMIQLMPNCPDEVITAIENKLKVLPTATELLSSGLSLEEIIKNIDKDANILDAIDVEFKCTCSKERFEAGIISLGKREIEEMIKENHTEAICNFCGQKYTFSIEDLIRLKNEAK